ncbi:MAG TPA: 50S ribosomal protein L3 [Candidatus Borkfalkia excrementavium]|uniref:Large ribosomal subunit protein uL3 n=1 Tax=Candidatus Borkfalkia excrementavium TaxID=2838505 RepID=A0A9D1Z7L3_9FIRM|nr:50S ribosomal protein L3 [Candidatus Borkfalkia excrementavium]
MNKAIIGRKVGMTQVFTPEGKVIPVTVVEAGPCPVVQIKTVEKDGYAALKLGFDETSEKRVNKPELGQFKKAGVKPQKVLKEFRLDDLSSYEVGKEVTVSVFKDGDKVDVVGTTKGHGYSGVIKRWNQRRLKETHGVGPVHREVGSMGANSTPSRVFKQKHMPGQYGNERVTVQNLEIVKVDAARNALLIKGAIPGAKGSVVTVSDSVKAK